MIIGIIGELGKGKTLLLTFLALMYKLNGGYVESNVLSMIPKDKYVKTIKDCANEYHKNGLLALDELKTLMDARTSGSKRNITGSYDILQTRKNGFDIAFTEQWHRNVDIRIRGVVNFYIYPYDIEILVYHKKPIINLLYEKKMPSEVLFTGEKMSILMPIEILQMYETNEKIQYKV